MSRPGEEDELRRMLAERAARAPAGEPLAERVLAALARGAAPQPPRRPYRWLVPVAAAALVVAGVGVGIGLRHGSVRNGTADAPAGTPASSGVHANRAPQQRTGADSGRFAATGVSFDAAGDGFAVGVGRVLRLSAGRWSAVGPAPGPTGQVSFTSAQVGYAFGPAAFFATSDGGRTWTRGSGGAIAVEPAGASALRLSVAGLSRLAGAGWEPVAVPGLGPVPADARLVTSGRSAEIAAGDTVYASADAGAHWTVLSADACPAGRLVDVAPGGVVACQDVGVTVYQLPARTPLARAPAPDARARLAGSAVSTLLAAGSLVRVRPAPIGAVEAVPRGAGTAVYLAFQPGSEQVVHYVGADGRTLWTSTDAGASWTSSVIG